MGVKIIACPFFGVTLNLLSDEEDDFRTGSFLKQHEVSGKEMFTNVCIETKLNTQTAKFASSLVITPPQEVDLTLSK